MKKQSAGLGAVPRTVWALGFVSLFMDVSSEMIHSILPVFLVALGASALYIGVIEGVAEAAASLTKVFSGWFSDRFRRRKLFALIGYGLSALSKPAFPLAATPAEVFVARLADRVGKGIRAAPRDALVADITPPAVRGGAYGLRQALDTAGAFAGPALALLLLALLAGDMRAVFWWSLLPALGAVLLLAFGVEEPAHLKSAPDTRIPVRLREVPQIGTAYWLVVAIGAVFTLARFSEAFLILRAENVGLQLALVPLVLIVMNIAYSLSAVPAGRLSDRIDRRWVLAAGLGVLILADAVLALWASPAGALAGAALWGLHMGLTQGLFAALVADCAPERLRGTAFGVFNLVTGVVLLAASPIAGALWQYAGPAQTFVAGALFAGLALAGLLAVLRRA